MKNSDKPAYPMPVAGCNDGGVYSIAEKDFDGIGLTKREMFAMAAMQGILSNPIRSSIGENAAKYAILYADELLKQLES